MTDHLTPDDAKRLLEGTTPGRWYCDGDDIYAAQPYEVGQDLGVLTREDHVAPADARLIAAAPALAAALAEHESEVEGWKAVARAKSAMIEMAQAEAAALRTEREALAGLLYDAIVSPSDDPLVFGVELDHDTGTAHLARTDTGGREDATASTSADSGASGDRYDPGEVT